MRYHFQTMNLIAASSHSGHVAALKEFNQNRLATGQEEFKILGCAGRLYIPSAELQPGDLEFIARTSGEGFQYDGVTLYYDFPQELQACLKLMTYGYCIQFYEIVVHTEFAIFVRKESQLIKDVERFVKGALS